MKIKKKSHNSINLESAHGGAGGRKLLVDNGEIDNIDFQAMTYGYLPSKGCFDWHNHENIEEIMLVIKGNGNIYDKDGKYEYSKGDVFIFPSCIEHKIENPSEEEHEYIFIRINKK